MPGDKLVQKRGTSTAITITLAGLASSATVGRESTVIDLGSTDFEDVQIQVVVELASGTPANDKAVYVYLYAAEDGTKYTYNATGADASLTLQSPTGFKLADVIPCPNAGGLPYEGNPFGVAQHFGGKLPRKVGIVVINYTGVTLESTGNSAYYSGFYMQTEEAA